MASCSWLLLLLSMMTMMMSRRRRRRRRVLEKIQIRTNEAQLLYYGQR